MIARLLILMGLLLAGLGPAMAKPEKIVVASKPFSESYVLAQISAQLLRAEGFEVEFKQGLGGTLIAFEALLSGAADVYPEYSGTLTSAVLKQVDMTPQAMNAALAERELEFAVQFGFNNNYAMAVTETLAGELALEKISDLARHPQLRMGFSHEFFKRKDGWPQLSKAYGLGQSASSLEHALAYRALENDHLDVTDAYTTDGELDLFDLRLLRDDLNFFPAYNAGLLIRNDLPADALSALSQLQGLIDEPMMRRLNRRVAIDGETPAQVASQFLRETKLVDGPPLVEEGVAARIVHNTLVHLRLTSIALLLGCLVAIPLALLVYRRRRIASSLQYIAGLLQTVPALALLALLIPLAGLGELPAIIALFLYSLLPIVRNTLTGLFNVDPVLIEVASGLGLTPSQQLRKVELPLALPTILAGIKTAAIISIGTATLAAFVGAGGLGEPIITGLTLNDHQLILQGAIPAAVLAIAVELLFEGIERATVPAHLRVE